MSDTRATSDRSERDAILAWGAGCAIGGAATLGMLILVFLVFLAIEPPSWIQVTIGCALAVGGAILSWLIASALGRRPPKSRDRRG